MGEWVYLAERLIDRGIEGWEIYRYKVDWVTLDQST